MRQQWRHLLFLHWPVAADQVQALLPPGLTVDTFDGKAYVGLIPFTITDARAAAGPAIPLMRRFHEVNVRTYVHVEGKDPGVWFFSLDATNPLAVAGARAAFKLPYRFATIQMSVSEEKVPLIDYRAQRTMDDDTRVGCEIRYRPREGAVGSAAAGTLDFFLIERYILYADARTNLYRARVHHEPYPLQAADLLALEETLVWSSRLRRPETKPLTQYSEGVDVQIWPLEKVSR